MTESKWALHSSRQLAKRVALAAIKLVEEDADHDYWDLLQGRVETVVQEFVNEI
jgi:hypothetical protein